MSLKHDMSLHRDGSVENVEYRVGLDRNREAVISSHFMRQLANHADLELYDEHQFAARSLEIDAEDVYGRLIPAMLDASTAFAAERAAAAACRARENYRKYGLDDPRAVGLAQSITEVMFDRQYRRESIETCSREVLCARVARRIATDSPIDMAIPALPFKFSSPLKNRAGGADLAELNFILGLYEIALTVELIYREGRPDLPGPLAGFTIVSDGSRFNRLVNEPDAAVESYRRQLAGWIERLRLDAYITLLDYRTLLRDNLPPLMWQRKCAIAHRARREYADALWPMFDPYRIGSAMAAAAAAEPDPEYSNREGRFVSLLKSLVFTIRYEALTGVMQHQPARYPSLYRELTGHLFEPYAVLSPAELGEVRCEVDAGAQFAPTDRVKECLRQWMLREAWSCAIDYLAEVRSDRDLAEDPILTCLPDHFRWTIHAKSGQLAVSTPIALGIRVQAWAGAAVFRRTKKNGIKLCTLPVLALEGLGATPVSVTGGEDAPERPGQPFFYIDPDVTFAGMDEFLSIVRTSLVRRRTG